MCRASCLNWMANTRGAWGPESKASTAGRVRLARTRRQSSALGAAGTAGAAGSTSAMARRATVGSLVISSSTPAAAAALMSASASSVYGTTRRPAVWAAAVCASVAPPDETQSWSAPLATAIPVESRVAELEERGLDGREARLGRAEVGRPEALHDQPSRAGSRWPSRRPSPCWRSPLVASKSGSVGWFLISMFTNAPSARANASTSASVGMRSSGDDRARDGAAAQHVRPAGPHLGERLRGHLAGAGRGAVQRGVVDDHRHAVGR